MPHDMYTSPNTAPDAVLIPFPEGCVVGRFVRREKRFFVAVCLEDSPGKASDVVWAHTNNTGSMLGLLREGAPVLLSPASNPKRKLRWTLELIGSGFLKGAPGGRTGRAPAGASAGAIREDARPEGGFWVGVNTATPNRLLEAAFKAGKLPWARGYTRLLREKVRGDSRIDALLEGPGLPRLWVECKNVTLVEDDVALFPDAVSTRGSKHLRTLADIVHCGERAATFYLVQRPDGRCFGPADVVDATYAEAFYAALAAGVEVYPHEALLSRRGIDIAQKCLTLETGPR